MDKQSLRQVMISKLKQLNTEEKERYENLIYQRLLCSDLWDNAQVIGVTYAQNFEWNTVPLIERALQTGKIVALPKCHPKTHTLTFYAIDHLDQLQPGYADLLEPDSLYTKMIPSQNIDLLFVPGIVFDKEGFRIGFGGGYYDRFLESYHGISASLAAEFQLMDQLPKETFDIPVQYVFTDERLLTT